MTISPPTHSSHNLIFGTVKDTDNIYYSTKNQVRGLCVGGDITILFLVPLYRSEKTGFTAYFRYIKNTGQNDGTPGLDLNVTHVWSRGITGKGVTIAILDDGVDYLHPDIGTQSLKYLFFINF